MRIDCVSPIRPLCGIYKSAPRWRESTNDGSKTSCALPHRSNREAPKALYSLYCSSKQPTIHYIAPKASVNSPRLSKVTGCRPSKRRDVYSFSILSISISFSILKFLSQSLLWICSSSFLLPLEYKSRSVLLPPIMCSSELVFQVSLTYCVRPHHQRRVRRLSCRWRR